MAKSTRHPCAKCARRYCSEPGAVCRGCAGKFPKAKEPSPPDLLPHEVRLLQFFRRFGRYHPEEWDPLVMAALEAGVERIAAKLREAELGDEHIVGVVAAMREDLPKVWRGEDSPEPDCESSKSNLSADDSL